MYLGGHLTLLMIFRSFKKKKKKGYKTKMV